MTFRETKAMKIMAKHAEEITYEKSETIGEDGENLVNIKFYLPKKWHRIIRFVGGMDPEKLFKKCLSNGIGIKIKNREVI